MSSERTSENIENLESPSTTEVASVETKPSEGWTWLYNTPKWHYFVDQESLCKRWILFTKGAFLEPDIKAYNSDYCKICRKKLKAMRPNI
jgi:hypothetical protein